MSVVRRAVRDGEVSAGLIAPRRSLPNGRAVAGGFFIVAAGVLAFSTWLSQASPAGREWVVARSAIPAGSVLGAGDVTKAHMSLSEGAGVQAFRSEAAVVGRTVVASLAPGELVEASDIAPLYAGSPGRPVTVTVAAAQVAGMGPGQLMDVLVTNGTSPSDSTLLVVSGARLTSVRPVASGLSGGDDVVTLGVSTLQEVEAVVHASATGTLSLVEGEPSDGSALGSGSGVGSGLGSGVGSGAGSVLGSGG